MRRNTMEGHSLEMMKLVAIHLKMIKETGLTRQEQPINGQAPIWTVAPRLKKKEAIPFGWR